MFATKFFLGKSLASMSHEFLQTLTDPECKQCSRSNKMVDAWSIYIGRHPPMGGCSTILCGSIVTWEKYTSTNARPRLEIDSRGSQRAGMYHCHDEEYFFSPLENVTNICESNFRKGFRWRGVPLQPVGGLHAHFAACTKTICPMVMPTLNDIGLQFDLRYEPNIW